MTAARSMRLEMLVIVQWRVLNLCRVSRKAAIHAVGI
jgi:hypothetical protein